MAIDLTKLSPAALKAAMEGGTTDWGEWGSATQHRLYAEPISSRRKCRRCKGRETHVAMANGVALTSGCELHVRRFIKRLGP